MVNHVDAHCQDCWKSAHQRLFVEGMLDDNQMRRLPSKSLHRMVVCIVGEPCFHILSTMHLLLSNQFTCRDSTIGYSFGTDWREWIYDISIPGNDIMAQSQFVITSLCACGFLVNEILLIG